MTPGTIAWNRRNEGRVNCCGERLCWRPIDARRRRRGWLNDVSHTGVSFLVETRKRPEEGQTIEIAPDNRAQGEVFVVLRVTVSFDGELALVACRRGAETAKVETPVAHGAEAEARRAVAA